MRPRLTLPPSQIAALRALIWVKAGGYAFAWLLLVMLVFSEPTSLYWDAEAQAEHLGRKPEPFQPMRRYDQWTFPRTGAKVPRRLRGGAFGKQDISQ